MLDDLIVVLDLARRQMDKWASDMSFTTIKVSIRMRLDDLCILIVIEIQHFLNNLFLRL